MSTCFRLPFFCDLLGEVSLSFGITSATFPASSVFVPEDFATEGSLRASGSAASSREDLM